MMRLLPFALLVTASAMGVQAHAGASPRIGSALDRTAVAVRSPERAVVLGAALAGERVVAVGERGLVILSDDHGVHWRQVLVPCSVTLTAVRFADERRGWAIGHGGLVLVTDDGGEHWQRQLDGRQIAQIVLDSARSAGDTRAVQDAERMVADGPDKPLLDLLLVDASHLLVVGAYGLALKSDDAGKTWTSVVNRLPNPKGMHLYAARKLNNTILIVGEQGTVLLSDDAGQSFRAVDTGYRGSFFTAEIMADQSLIAAGLRGNVLRSGDGGSTWQLVGNTMSVNVTGSTLNTDGRLLLVNQAGVVLTLVGSSLAPVNDRALPPLNGLLTQRNAPLLALSVQGVLPVPPRTGNTK